MSTRGHPRKADSRCESIQCPRHPAVVVVSAGDDCGHRKHSGGVAGREGATLKGGLTAIKEGIVERPSRWNITRSLSACNGFDRQVDDCTVRVSLSCE